MLGGGNFFVPNSIDQLPFSFQKIFLKHNTSCFFFFMAVLEEKSL